jgi:hypothetical protein
MGGEHGPCMFYGFTTDTKYNDTDYNFTTPRTPTDNILYYCIAITKPTPYGIKAMLTNTEIKAAIAEYEITHADKIAAFNEFAKLKGKHAEWQLGLWGNISCNWRHTEGEDD